MGKYFDSYFSPNGGAADFIIGFIDRTENRLDIAVYSFTHDEIADAVIRAHQRGVKVRVLTDKLQASNQYADDEKLESFGIPVRRDTQSGLMHHKFAISDDNAVGLGSFNWSVNADTRNMENWNVVRLKYAVEEYSDYAGTTNYATPFQLRNKLTTMRKSYAITGSAKTDVMVIAMKDPKSGKTSILWENYQEWIALQQWYKELECSAWYSEFNSKADGSTDLIGPNGNPIHIGAGLRQQIAPANKRSYTVLTEKIIREFLHDLSYNTLPNGQRKFVAMTGEMGMDLFDRAMRTSVSGLQLVDSKFVTGSGQELSLGGQFTTYKGLNGTEITLKHLPMYDDPIINRTLHPQSGRPLESYRFTFLDFGLYDGESNIVKVAKKDREMVMWHTAGSVDPSGHAKSTSTMRSDNKDGYSVHYLSECGIMVKNPMSCGELILEA